MADMTSTDKKKWAREEIMGAIDAHLTALLSDPNAEIELDEAILLRKERYRVAKFLGMTCDHCFRCRRAECRSRGAVDSAHNAMLAGGARCPHCTLGRDGTRMLPETCTASAAVEP